MAPPSNNYINGVWINGKSDPTHSIEELFGRFFLGVAVKMWNATGQSAQSLCSHLAKAWSATNPLNALPMLPHPFWCGLEVVVYIERSFISLHFWDCLRCLKNCL